MIFIYYTAILMFTAVIAVTMVFAINLFIIAPKNKLKKLHKRTRSAQHVMEGYLHLDFGAARTDEIDLGFSVINKEDNLYIRPNGTYADHEVVRALLR